MTNRHDDVIKWKHFPRYWPFVRGIYRSPVNSHDKGQYDLKRHGAHYYVIVMLYNFMSRDCSVILLQGYLQQLSGEICCDYEIAVLCISNGEVFQAGETFAYVLNPLPLGRCSFKSIIFKHIIQIVAWALAVKLLSDECQRAALMKSQHKSRYRHGAVREQAITRGISVLPYGITRLWWVNVVATKQREQNIHIHALHNKPSFYLHFARYSAFACRMFKAAKWVAMTNISITLAWKSLGTKRLYKTDKNGTDFVGRISLKWYVATYKILETCKETIS